MTECTRTISPADVEGLRALLSEASDGSVICFTSGVYRVNLTIEKSLTLRAVGRVVLDGGMERSTIRVVKDGRIGRTKAIAGRAVNGNRDAARATTTASATACYVNSYISVERDRIASDMISAHRRPTRADRVDDDQLVEVERSNFQQRKLLVRERRVGILEKAVLNHGRHPS